MAGRASTRARVVPLSAHRPTTRGWPGHAQRAPRSPGHDGSSRESASTRTGINVELSDGLVVSRVQIGEERPKRLVTGAPFGWIRSPSKQVQPPPATQSAVEAADQEVVGDVEPPCPPLLRSLKSPIAPDGDLPAGRPPPAHWRASLPVACRSCRHRGPGVDHSMVLGAAGPLTMRGAALVTRSIFALKNSSTSSSYP